MAKITYVEHGGKEHVVEVANGLTVMEGARDTAPGGTFATYTAAGHVRQSLAQAGFAITRQPGFGRKRHMTTGQL